MKRHTWEEIKAKAKPETIAAAAEKTRQMVERLHLADLRKAREMTQEDLARSLKISQTEVSQIERRSEVYISTLRRYIGALGGDVVITARFGDGVDVPLQIGPSYEDPPFPGSDWVTFGEQDPPEGLVFFVCWRHTNMERGERALRRMDGEYYTFDGAPAALPKAPHLWWRLQRRGEHIQQTVERS
jgi:transcriptional regulator with XRE-family HTH domain